MAESRLADLRRQLAEAQIDQTKALDGWKVQRARAEVDAIDAAGGEKAIGSNAEARDRALTLALEADDQYRDFRLALRLCEAAVIRLTAEVEIEKDIRRERELRVRERFASAVEVIEARDNGDAIDALACIGEGEE